MLDNSRTEADGIAAETENKGDNQMTKVTPFLMFNDQLEAAIAFYTTTFCSECFVGADCT